MVRRRRRRCLNDQLLRSFDSNVTQALHHDNAYRERWRKAIIADVDAILALKTLEDIDPETTASI